MDTSISFSGTYIILKQIFKCQTKNSKTPTYYKNTTPHTNRSQHRGYTTPQITLKRLKKTLVQTRMTDE
jgi:hypothetical protein